MSEISKLRKEVKQLRKEFQDLNSYIRGPEPESHKPLRAVRRKSSYTQRYETILSLVGDEWVSLEQIRETAGLPGGYDTFLNTVKDMVENSYLERREDSRDRRRHLYRRGQTAYILST